MSPIAQKTQHMNEGRKPSTPENKNSPACFASLNQFEILVDGRKLVGSAQKRTKKGFIQHGSILIDFNAELFASLLNINDTVSSKEQVDKLIHSVVTLNQIRQKTVEYSDAVNALRKGFQKALPGNWASGDLLPEEEKLRVKLSRSSVIG